MPVVTRSTCITCRFVLSQLHAWTMRHALLCFSGFEAKFDAYDGILEEKMCAMVGRVVSRMSICPLGISSPKSCMNIKYLFDFIWTMLCAVQTSSCSCGSGGISFFCLEGPTCKLWCLVKLRGKLSPRVMLRMGLQVFHRDSGRSDADIGGGSWMSKGRRIPGAGGQSP